MKRKHRVTLCLACFLSVGQLLIACTPSSSTPVDTVSDQWKITLDYNDGISRNGTLYVDKGESVQLPTTQVYKGYAFAGWMDANDEIVSNTYTPTADVTLKAKWTTGSCTVTYDLNYEGSTPITQTVQYGTTITDAPTPVRDGFNFRYWTLIPDGNEVDLSTYIVKGNYTFYASWIDADVKEYTVTITAGQYEGAPKDTVLTLTDGESIKKSNKAFKVTRTGYDLAGWTTVAPADNKTWSIDDYENIATLTPTLISLPYTPTDSCTIYAVWTIQQYDVVWNANYTDSPYTYGVYKSEKILSNQVVVAPTENPTRENYTFDGWYTSALGNTKVDFSNNDVKITSTSGYYAHWKHNGVKTDTFQAEYVYFDSTKEYWGYSGSVRGQKCIVKDGGTVGTVSKDDYPTNSKLAGGNGYYVSYQYELGDTLRFEINSSKATTATLKASLAVENMQISAIGSSGEFSNLFKVNGTSIDYSLNLSLMFAEYTIGNVSLNEGLNVIEIVVNNSNTVLGGTYKAVGFNTDYIKLTDSDANFTWSPIYDNLEAI